MNTVAASRVIGGIAANESLSRTAAAGGDKSRPFRPQCIGLVNLGLRSFVAFPRLSPFALSERRLVKAVD